MRSVCVVISCGAVTMFHAGRMVDFSTVVVASSALRTRVYVKSTLVPSSVTSVIGRSVGSKGAVPSDHSRRLFQPSKSGSASGALIAGLASSLEEKLRCCQRMKSVVNTPPLALPGEPFGLALSAHALAEL